MNKKEKIYVYDVWEDSDVIRWAWDDWWGEANGMHRVILEEDMEKKQSDLFEILDGRRKYFVFNLIEHGRGNYTYYGVYMQDKRMKFKDYFDEDGYYHVDDYIVADGKYYDGAGVFAVKQKDFDYDIDKAFKFAKEEINYVNELNEAYYSTVIFNEYKYNDDTKEYERTNDLYINKSLEDYKLHSILKDIELDTKEKLLEILKDENLIDGDLSEDGEFDFLRDKDSVVISKETLKGMPKELHEIIHLGYLAREFEDKLVVDDASVSENIEQEKEPIDFSKTNKRVMKM